MPSGTAEKAAPRRPLVPNQLRYLRERGRTKGGLWLTQQEVADCLGIALATVSRHESNERSLSEEDVIRYSALYKVRPDQLFKGLTESKRR